jgi:hypothetical protein
MIPRDEPARLTPPAGAERPPMTARTMLLVSAAITLLLYMLPFGRLLARPLLLLSTVAHEMGHGITCLLLGGDFQRLMMWSDGSGVSQMDVSRFGRLRQGLTLAGGLVGPAVAAALCFALGRTSHGARWCLLGLGFLLVGTEILVVRNAFGLVFVGLVAAGCLFGGFRATPAVAQLAVIFLAVQLALSVFSRADYLFTRAAKNPTGLYPSDVQRMEEILFLPYWFWGGVCAAFAIAVVAWGLRLYWRQ